MDAHELLRFLLDGVSMEEIDVSARLPSFSLLTHCHQSASGDLS